MNMCNFYIICESYDEQKTMEIHNGNNNSFLKQLTHQFPLIDDISSDFENNVFPKIMDHLSKMGIKQKKDYIPNTHSSTYCIYLNKFSDDLDNLCKKIILIEILKFIGNIYKNNERVIENIGFASFKNYSGPISRFIKKNNNGNYQVKYTISFPNKSISSYISDCFVSKIDEKIYSKALEERIKFRIGKSDIEIKTYNDLTIYCENINSEDIYVLDKIIIEELKAHFRNYDIRKMTIESLIPQKHTYRGSNNLISTKVQIMSQNGGNGYKYKLIPTLGYEQYFKNLTMDEIEEEYKKVFGLEIQQEIFLSDSMTIEELCQNYETMIKKLENFLDNITQLSKNK